MAMQKIEKAMHYLNRRMSKSDQRPPIPFAEFLKVFAANPYAVVRNVFQVFHDTIKAYVGEGDLVDDELRTFGTRAVAHIPDLQGLMRHVCRNGFEHHVAMSASRTADILEEALGNYLGWELHRHRG